MTNTNIEFMTVEVPYKKLWRDIFLSVNGKEVRVYFVFLHDEEEQEYKSAHEINESDSENLTDDEYKAVEEWCETHDLEHIEEQ